MIIHYPRFWVFSMKSNWLNMVEFLYMSHVFLYRKIIYWFYFKSYSIWYIQFVILFSLTGNEDIHSALCQFCFWKFVIDRAVIYLWASSNYLCFLFCLFIVFCFHPLGIFYWDCWWWFNPTLWDAVEPRPCFQGEPTWWSFVHMISSDFAEAFYYENWMNFIFSSFVSYNLLCNLTTVTNDFPIQLARGCSWSKTLLQGEPTWCYYISYDSNYLSEVAYVVYIFASCVHWVSLYPLLIYFVLGLKNS